MFAVERGSGVTFHFAFLFVLGNLAGCRNPSPSAASCESQLNRSHGLFIYLFIYSLCKRSLASNGEVFW